MIIKNSLWVDERYKDLFKSVSLDSFKKLYDDKSGQLVRAEPEKSIHYFKIKEANSMNGFYIKRERPNFALYLKNMVKKYILKRKNNYGLKIRHELDLIRLYQKQGVSVVEPVAIGEQSVFGIPVRGFLVQKEVAGDEFTGLMKRGSLEERIRLIKAYAKFVAELHSKGLISTITRVTDCICTSSLAVPWQDICLVVIDREKGPLEIETFSLEKAGYALASILIRFFIYIDAPSSREIRCFLKVYIKYIEIPNKPSFRSIFLNTQSSFKKLLNKFKNQIHIAHHDSFCIHS